MFLILKKNFLKKTGAFFEARRKNRALFCGAAKSPFFFTFKNFFRKKNYSKKNIAV
jgi:hypothetical protein